jgi:ABC-type thiamine transport system ATPase subunit
VPKDVLDRHMGKDRVAIARAEYRERPDPSFATYGPKTRREFLRLKAWGG